MFVVLGLIPGYVIAKVLHGMGKLRIPREAEIAGLDYEIMEAAKDDEKAVELTLFSGDLRKYGLTKAMNRSNKNAD